MATYVTLYRYTDEGMKNIKKAPELAKEWEAQAKQLGVQIKALYWLQGPWDAITIVESDNEEAVNGLLYAIGQQGYLRSETMRGFNKEVLEKSLEKGLIATARR